MFEHKVYESKAIIVKQNVITRVIVNLNAIT